MSVTPNDSKGDFCPPNCLNKSLAFVNVSGRSSAGFLPCILLTPKTPNLYCWRTSLLISANFPKTCNGSIYLLP